MNTSGINTKGNMEFVDTNYFIRYFLKDNQEQYKIAYALFHKAILGEKILFTSLIVFLEIYWLMFSYYKKKKEEVIGILYEVLEMDYIELKEREILRQALQIYKESNLDLEDSFNLVYSQVNNASSFATFDKKLISKFKSFQQN